MKYRFLFILYVLASTGYGQLSNFDFDKNKVIPDDSGGSSRSRLKLNIYYDFLDYGTLDLSQHGVYFMPEDLPENYIRLKVDPGNIHNSFPFHRNGFGKQLCELFYPEAEPNSKGEVFVPLDNRTYLFIWAFGDLKIVLQDRRTRLEYGFAGVTSRALSKEDYDKLVDYLLQVYYPLKLGDFKDTIAAQIKGALIDKAEVKVERINPADFNDETFFMDFFLKPDVKDKLTLNVIGCDGQKLAEYSADIKKDVLPLACKYFKTNKDSNTGVIQESGNASVTPGKYFSAAVRVLVNMFMKDISTIAKINRQKETMQNTYKSDQDRRSQLITRLRLYQEQREYK